LAPRVDFSALLLAFCSIINYKFEQTEPQISQEILLLPLARIFLTFLQQKKSSSKGSFDLLFSYEQSISAVNFLEFSNFHNVYLFFW
jgi:hypothetical protein